MSVMREIEEIMLSEKGKIFSINDFLYLGSVNTVKSALYRMHKEGKITRLLDGLYTIPEYSYILNEYAYPDADDIAIKIAQKFCWNIAPASNNALNFTGLSSQVSNTYEYVSDGPYREYLYRNTKIIFKHTANRYISFYSKKLATLIQALKGLGQNNIGDREIAIMACYAMEIDDDLIKDTFRLPAWIREALGQIYEVNNASVSVSSYQRN